MTWLPLDSRKVVAGEGPNYELNIFCPVPGCPNEASERHHLWRRSFLNGDFWWVVLPDGETVGNCMKFCNRHHEELTVNKSRVEYEEGVFYWNTMSSVKQKLRWQPPFLGGLWEAENLAVGHVLADTHNRETCPTCMRPMPKPKVDTPVEEKKIRKTWALAVPKDHVEDGADVLDTLLEEIRDELARAGLPYGDSSTAKYHVLATAMALFLTHAKEIL